MKKKIYIQPSISTIRMQNRHQLLSLSGITTTSASDDVNLGYDENGGDQGEAW